TALHEAASEPDPLRRVHDLAFDPDLEIDERAAIRRSNGAESLAGFELVTDGDIDGSEVRAHRVMPATVIEDHRSPVFGVRIGERDAPRMDGAHRRSGRCGQLEAVCPARAAAGTPNFGPPGHGKGQAPAAGSEPLGSAANLGGLAPVHGAVIAAPPRQERALERAFALFGRALKRLLPKARLVLGLEGAASRAELR